MNENYDTYAVAIIIVFGALLVGGLMAAGIAFNARDAFLFALGAAAAAWLSGYAVFFDRPRTFMICIAVSIAMAVGSTLVLAF